MTYLTLMTYQLTGSGPVRDDDVLTNWPAHDKDLAGYMKVKGRACKLGSALPG